MIAVSLVYAAVLKHTTLHCTHNFIQMMDTRTNTITAALAPTHGMQPVLRSHDYSHGSANDVVLGYEGGKMEVIDLRMLTGESHHSFKLYVYILYVLYISYSTQQ
jgi:hypothetical protein